jgi:ornithine cyclodeaminase/alanine dehydrogenase-like protein (mu-crystallin family)
MKTAIAADLLAQDNAATLGAGGQAMIHVRFLRAARRHCGNF